MPVSGMGRPPHRVAVLALDDVHAFDLGIADRVFDVAVDPHDRPLYEVVVFTLDGASVRTSAGFRLQPAHGADTLTWAHTLVVPPVRRGAAAFTGSIDPALAAALTSAARRRVRIISLCTGAFILAAAGLLDGRPATTHWAFTDRLRELHPAVRLDRGVLFVDDGDLLTSAGAAAGVDLCLHVVRRDHGCEVADRAARHCVVPPRREDARFQFLDRPPSELTGSGTAPTRGWALTRLHEPLSLHALAGHARMSVRTFTRRFRQETGLSPARWLNQRRVDRARHLLETTDLPIEQVAREVGFGTSTALRTHMRTSIGVAPNTYRRAFRDTNPTFAAPTPTPAATPGPAAPTPLRPLFPLRPGRTPRPGSPDEPNQ